MRIVTSDDGSSNGQHSVNSNPPFICARNSACSACWHYGFRPSSFAASRHPFSRFTQRSSVLNIAVGDIVGLEMSDGSDLHKAVEGGPQVSSCEEIEKDMPGILEFITKQRSADKAGRKFHCLGAWTTEGPAARAVWVKYKIGKGDARMCEVRALHLFDFATLSRCTLLSSE